MSHRLGGRCATCEPDVIVRKWANVQDNDAYRHMAESSTKTYREFEHATLKAVVLVTEGLVLRPPGDGSEQAGNAVKTRIFYRYYAYLVKVLERSHLAEVCLLCHGVVELTT